MLVSPKNNNQSYTRFKTKVINIGNLPLGGEYPIRIQSMTNTNTLDTNATVEQSIRMINAGCEYVRITAPGVREAKNLLNIKNRLKQKGYTVPLIADIHFNPKAAEIAAQIVEKVRINPGNYIDKNTTLKHSYTDNEYNQEIEKIKQGISPLIKICKEHDTAIRIGTNHGSLSNRIVSRYGDTSIGMVESALEFIHICEELNFENIVLSMKSSNVRVMIEAYRLLVERMIKENLNYPLHLGVTEAGEGEEGRIKSALGIGTLLEDGIGDTIRVSLTEEPEAEIPIAKLIAERYNIKTSNNSFPFQLYSKKYAKRASINVANIGETNVPIVIADISQYSEFKETDLFSLGFMHADKLIKSDTSPDYIYIGNSSFDFLNHFETIVNIANPNYKSCNDSNFPILTKNDLKSNQIKFNNLKFLLLNAIDFDDILIEQIKKNQNIVLIFEANSFKNITHIKKCIDNLSQNNCNAPIIIKKEYAQESNEQFQISAAIDFGAILIDGLIDGIWINASKEISLKTINHTAFNILQASRTRISKTEYISCPSCGRTMFNILEATAQIKAKTQHLKGLKIGIMGCIVNGPGEMADADYGYVGAGANKVNLYKGKKLINKAIPASEAIEALINLIKVSGDWKDE